MRVNKTSDISSSDQTVRRKLANTTYYPRSYRLNSQTKEILTNKILEVNSLSDRKISEARFVKALIFISKNLSAEEILKAAKEVW